MSRVLDPNTDSKAYAQIQSLVGITSTPAEIDASPLFWSAESAVLAEVPDAALPGGRTHASRTDIVNATVFLTVANYFLSGADDESSSGGSRETGVVKSETIGSVRREYAVDANTIAASASLSKEDRAAWFENAARKILASLVSVSVETEAIATVNIKETF